VKLKDHPRFRDQLDDESIELLYLSAPLHDVGKVGVRDNVLLNTGKLTDEEFVLMKKHTDYGQRSPANHRAEAGQKHFSAPRSGDCLFTSGKMGWLRVSEGLKGDEIPSPAA